MKDCEQLSGVVCKPNKYRQHGRIYWESVGVENMHRNTLLT
jgi:hypothetical protein